MKDEENGNAENQPVIVSLLNRLAKFLFQILIAIIILSVFLAIKNDIFRKDDPPPQETLNQELFEALPKYENLRLENGTLYIDLKPYQSIELAVYQTKKFGDGRPFVIICGQNKAESCDDGYCILNGEIIPTLEALAERSSDLTGRLRIEEYLTPEELKIHDHYFYTCRYSGEEKATQDLADELGLSYHDALCTIQNIYNLAEHHYERLSPELLNENILQPALDYQPGTADASMWAAYAAEKALGFITDYHIHLEDQDYVNHLMAGAFALLTEEEQAQLKETLPDLIDLIDETIEIFPENRDLYKNTGSVYLIDNAMFFESVGEDWERLKTGIICTGVPKKNNIS